MKENQSKWVTRPPLPPEIRTEFQIYPQVLQQLLYNRGFDSLDKAERFLDARLPEDVKDTHPMGIDQASDRLEKAIANGEHIAIYGDFDVDGITSTALLKSSLEELGGQVSTYIPHRVDEGYGLNTKAIQALRNTGVDLLITVDCGIRAITEIEYAKKIGLDVIITDHHQPGNTLPKADLIINPNQPLDPYPNKDLAGVGVAYKLLQKLAEHKPHLKPEKFLDLVSLGTIADLVPLRGENRHYVREGLRDLKQPHRQGIFALMGVSGLSPENIQASDISFQLGPRINAAGRLSSADLALDLLLEKDVKQAGLLAQKIEILNNKRKELMHDVRIKAENMALVDDEIPSILFAFHPDFDQGIVGLAAGYLTEKYHRPAIVGKQGDEVTIASCRSIDEFDIIKALDMNKKLFLSYGGHSAAAGFKIKNENIPALKDSLTKFSSITLEKIDLTPTLTADMELSFNDLDRELLKQFHMLAPTGMGNPQPQFISYDIYINKCRQVGKQNNHLKLELSDGSTTFDAIAFRKGELSDSLPSRVDILYKFEENIYRGRSRLQLNIKEIRPAISLSPQTDI
ncbi:MAG: single-stranded-DNA-specific exonuclease RecJ [Anaerolineales bacterium]|nr:single-stranded-DNA-specific exonuclease RecJ [Anaerolineales bacterium]